MTTDTKPTADFSTRLASARKFRDAERPYIEEVQSFCRPGSEHDFSSSSKDQVHDAETFVSVEDLATDLAGDLVTYFTPSEARWHNYLVTAPVNEEDAEAVMEMVKAREDDLDDLISGSNYNDMAPQWAFEAATHGTPALWVQQGHLQQPIYFEAVPPSELLITPGYLGILDRFRECTVPAQSLKALFTGFNVDLSDQQLEQKMKKPNQNVKVVWGFWVDWSDAGNPKWRCEITADGKRITPTEPLTLGPLAGTCPLLVGRFNPQPGRPWGRGAGRAALNELRVWNNVSEVVLAGLDQSISTTLIYADDGHIDLSEGVVGGRAYPANRGFTRDNIVDLSKSVNVDQGWFAEDRIEDRIRRYFYQDGPRQRGDTPPTASQWIDERRRVQQRIGKPSAPLWTEMILPMIQRIEYLGVQSAKISEALSHNGQAISVKPISPLQKAQNQDQVMIAQSNLGLAFQTFQDQVTNFVDPLATFANIVKASGDDLTVLRKQEVQPETAGPQQ